MSAVDDKTMEKIVALCKRRGFVFQSSEIYGGLNSCWDYGPLGVELKRNVKDAWWRSMVTTRDDIVGLDASILMHPKVWETSGHVAGFSDPLVDCKKCKARFREDHLETARCPEKPSKKPGECDGELTEARQFNLMFKTHLGPVEDAGHVVFLRPETAQGIFVNFKNVVESSRMKPPFGVAQVGKSFRNEITPGNFTFRTREFEQMEMEFFVPPDEAGKWFDYWCETRRQWYIDHGIKEENLQMRKHGDDELAHYSVGCQDVEYRFPFGWSELEGIANRTDFDLKRHSEASGENLTYFDNETNSHYTPYVIEPAAGADRATLAFLVDSYEEEKLEKETRTVLHLHPRLAPIKAAILPLVKREEGMVKMATDLASELRAAGIRTFYDEKSAIGRRYRRMDEAGTPFCFTIDSDSLEDGTVTCRERDSMEQTRMSAKEVSAFLREKI
ncbi:MAG: glycine--tRNA ligase [Planctomycetota bacterium]